MATSSLRTLLLPTLVLTLAIPCVAGANAATTTVSSTLGSVISLFTTSGSVSLNLVPSAAGTQTIASDTVTISTNDAAGYTLQLAEATASSAMTSGGNSIPAGSGSKTTPAALSPNTWGYRVDGAGGFGTGPTTAAASQPISATTFAAVPVTASPDTLVATSSTASNSTTTVWYGLAASTSKPNGTYSNTVTYTATPN